MLVNIKMAVESRSLETSKILKHFKVKEAVDLTEEFKLWEM